MINPDTLYSIDEIVEQNLLPVKRPIIFKLIISGQLIAIDVAAGNGSQHRWRIKGSDIIEFIKKRRTDSPEMKMKF